MNLLPFAPRALRELQAATEWISRQNPAAAQALVTQAIHAADRPVRQPKIGRHRPDLLPEPYRFWSLRGFLYLLVYDSAARPPRILRVLHMARDLGSVLDDFDP
jgi:toxin ParE1/3/4